MKCWNKANPKYHWNKAIMHESAQRVGRRFKEDNKLVSQTLLVESLTFVNGMRF
jgi:hypothetical protein